MPPRLPPLRPDELDDLQQEVLAPYGFGVNLFPTLVRHPRLFQAWTEFGAVLLTGELPGRDRELLILRTAHLTGSAYERHQHEPIARVAGLTGDEVARVADGAETLGWSPHEQALLRAVDQLHRQGRIDDETWHVLAATYTDRQLIEVCMVVGQYHLVAFAAGSLGVEIEGGEPSA